MMKDRHMRKVLILGAFTIALTVHGFAQYFPETGPAALRQRALDTRSRLNVLSIALQPGHEDLAGLAYYRMAIGARIVSAYVTNGESGESDLHGEYPNQLAAARRSEAASVMAFLDGEEYFLNMPDIGAVKDTSIVRDLWKSDSLLPRLTKLISDLKPDVILLARDWRTMEESPERLVLREVLLRALNQFEPRTGKKPSRATEMRADWSVARVFLETGTVKGVRIPIHEIHPLWKKSYQALGDEAGLLYHSCFAQRKLWYGSDSNRTLISYESVYPQSPRPAKRFDDGFPRRVPGAIAGIDKKIVSLVRTLIGGDPRPSERSRARRDVADLIDSVDYFLGHPMELNSMGRKIAMQWKLSLEQLRVSILGVELRYTFEPRIITGRQLAFLKIDTVLGTQPKDSVWLYFPGGEERWAVDESSEKMHVLRYDSPYRLLSPGALDYHLPAAMDGLSRSSVGRTHIFFLMCRAKSREYSFILRASQRLLYSPRFTTEVLTPIVFAVPNEQVILRTSNHSRDGIRDSLHVDDTLAVSAKKEFRLNLKDESEVDTLELQWKRSLAEGTYLLPVSIGGQPVTNVAARAFDVNMDRSKDIALVTGLSGSPTAVTLRRLGARWTEIREARGLSEQLDRYNIVIIDRRALTLVEGLPAETNALRAFSERGGHLIILAQDAAVWKRNPLVPDLELSASNAWGEGEAVRADSTHRLFNEPNKLQSSAWADWFYRRTFNNLAGSALTTARIVLSSADGKNPMIVEWPHGKGLITYVDLALPQQLLNVHPGAMRLLANLASY